MKQTKMKNVVDMTLNTRMTSIIIIHIRQLFDTTTTETMATKAIAFVLVFSGLLMYCLCVLVS